MKSEVLEKVTDVGSTAAQLGVRVDCVKEAVADALEDGVKATRRAVKQGRRGAEDLVDDAEHQIKQHPLSTVGTSFGIGLGLGVVIGMLLARNGHRR